MHSFCKIRFCAMWYCEGADMARRSVYLGMWFYCAIPKELKDEDFSGCDHCQTYRASSGGCCSLHEKNHNLGK